MIPSYLKKYFWDTDTCPMDIGKYKMYIIERILEMGDERAAAWMKKSYSRKDIVGVLKKSVRLSPISENYWNIMYKLK